MPGYHKDAELLREIDGHQGQVLNLAFKTDRIDGYDRLTLFSSGSNGSIVAYRPQPDTHDPSLWMPVSRIRIPELKNVPINSIQVSPSQSKMLLCCRDGVLRMIDYQL